MEITQSEYNELKSHSQMLGIIGSYVEDFCQEDDTTLQGVLRLLADYHLMLGEQLLQNISKYDTHP